MIKILHELGSASRHVPSLISLEKREVESKKEVIPGKENATFEMLLGGQSQTIKEIKQHEVGKKPTLEPEECHPKSEKLSNEDFWNTIMKVEGRDFAMKLLQKNFGIEDGLTVKLSTGKRISLSGEVGPADFGIISSLWNKYR